MKRHILRPLPEDNTIPTFGAVGLAADIIRTRGIKEEFFGQQPLSSPFLINNMRKAAELVAECIKRGDKICVFGDYDCDGVTSTAILYRFLHRSDVAKENLIAYIPDRFTEGYGMNMSAVKKLAADGVKLVITVDNGISAYNEIAFLKEQGVSVIVTDHHKPPEKLPPADFVIDPNTDDDTSGLSYLAGCGVALKFVYALYAITEGFADSADIVTELADLEEMLFAEYIELAAVGTVADIVPLVGENRRIVNTGLSYMPFTETEGLRALMKQCGVYEFTKTGGTPLNARAIGWSAAPRINSAGRLGTANAALDLFLADIYKEQNDGKSFTEYADPMKLAEMLSKLNEERKAVESAIVLEAETALSEDPSALFDKVLIVSGNGWHKGVIGNVASKLVEKYGKPTAVISVNEGAATGSMRSVDGFSVFAMLDYCKALLPKYGGHTGAGGFSLAADDIAEFTDKCREYAKDIAVESKPLIIDKVLNAADITVKNIDSLAVLEPFGEGNPDPLFMLKNAVITGKYGLKDGKYTRINLDYQGGRFEVLDWNTRCDNFPYLSGEVCDICVSLSVNEYNGKTEPQLRLADIRYAGINQDRYFAAMDAYEAFRRGEPIPDKLLPRFIPDRGAVTVIFEILKTARKVSRCLEVAVLRGVNGCMTNVALDMLSECGIIMLDRARDTVTLVPRESKADIFAAKTYVTLIRLAEKKNEE